MGCRMRTAIGPRVEPRNSAGPPLKPRHRFNRTGRVHGTADSVISQAQKTASGPKKPKIMNDYCGETALDRSVRTKFVQCANLTGGEDRTRLKKLAIAETVRAHENRMWDCVQLPGHVMRAFHFGIRFGHIDTERRQRRPINIGPIDMLRQRGVIHLPDQIPPRHLSEKPQGVALPGKGGGMTPEARLVA